MNLYASRPADGTLEEYEPFGVLNFCARAPVNEIYTIDPLPWDMDSSDCAQDVKSIIKGTNWEHCADWRNAPSLESQERESGAMSSGNGGSMDSVRIGSRRCLRGDEDPCCFHDCTLDDFEDLWQQQVE